MRLGDKVRVTRYPTEVGMVGSPGWKELEDLARQVSQAKDSREYVYVIWDTSSPISTFIPRECLELI